MEIEYDGKNCFLLVNTLRIHNKLCLCIFNLWLIEVNTNPCLELASPLLSALIPRMLDDAFKLTLDVVFNKNKLKLSHPEKNDQKVNNFT